MLIDILIGVAVLVCGSLIGLMRLVVLLLTSFLFYLVWLFYRSFHSSLAEALAVFVSFDSAFYISIFVLVLSPVLVGVFCGLKLLNWFNVYRYGSGMGDSGFVVVDKLLGGCFGILILVIVYSIL